MFGMDALFVGFASCCYQAVKGRRSVGQGGEWVLGTGAWTVVTSRSAMSLGIEVPRP